MALRKQPPNQFEGVIYPRFYHYRKGVSDRGWILSRMAVIPVDKQQEIAFEYERLYMGSDNQSRKRANTWLDGLAREYRKGGA